jgi:hypothetical protein
MRFQFSIRDLLIATGLIAVGIWSGVYLGKIGLDEFDPFTPVFYFSCMVIGAGIGQLFHKPFLGCLLGFCAATVTVALTFLWMFVRFGHGC